MSSRPLPSWYRQTTVTEGVTEDRRVEGFVGRGWRWSTITPNRHGVRRGSATQQLQAEALLTELGLLGEPASQPDAPFPALECDGGKATPGFSPCKVSTDGMVSIPTLKGGDNDIEGLCITLASQVCQCRRLQNTATPPPVVLSGEGVDRGGREGVAELGDGVAAPVDAGEGAIDPS